MLKVKFELPTLKKEAEMLAHFCRPLNRGWDWSEKVFRNHPELKEILRDKKPNEFYTYARAYSTGYIRKNKKSLNRSVKEYQKQWNKINDKYIGILSEHFETDYPKNRKVIRAYVSIVPIFPRFLDEWSFNVSHKNPDRIIQISMHEILHFFYFKKWIEVFPKTKRRELDSPHLVWRLSEILDPIILNYNGDIQKLFKYKHNHYLEFQDIKIGNNTMIEHFEELYKQYLKSSQPFESFLKTCWGETKKHRKIIEAI